MSADTLECPICFVQIEADDIESHAQICAQKKFDKLTFAEAKRMRVAELREEMRKRGLDATGTKKKMLNRIRHYLERGMYHTRFYNAFSKF